MKEYTRRIIDLFANEGFTAAAEKIFAMAEIIELIIEEEKEARVKRQATPHFDEEEWQDGIDAMEAD